jgi:hypothetical protein
VQSSHHGLGNREGLSTEVVTYTMPRPAIGEAAGRVFMSVAAGEYTRC